MKKKIISLMMVCLLLIGIAIPASANENNTLTNDINNDGKITVTLTISKGNGYDHSAFYSKETVCKELQIPYFDLALYDLDGLYYNPNCYESAVPDEIFYGGTAGTQEQAEGNVTLLHAYIFATEVLCLGMSQDEAGQGASYESGLLSNYFAFTGTPGSTYIVKFLGLDWCNLQYYVNHEFPLAKKGLGSTADQIVLSDNDHISLHMIGDTSSMVYGTSMGHFESNGEKNTVYAKQGDSVDFTLNYPSASSKSGINVYVNKGLPTSAEPSGWNSDHYTTNGNGLITVDTSKMDTGIYYLATDAAKVFGDLYSMNKEPSVAMIRLVVEEPEAEVVYGDVNDDGKINSTDASLILRYASNISADIEVDAADVNNDGKINSTDASLILRYASKIINEFPRS